jgi:hypothetical protein
MPFWEVTYRKEGRKEERREGRRGDEGRRERERKMRERERWEYMRGNWGGCCPELLVAHCGNCLPSTSNQVLYIQGLSYYISSC